MISNTYAPLSGEQFTLRMLSANAVEQLENGNAAAAEFLKQFGGYAQPIRITDTSNESVSLRVIPKQDAQ